MTLCKSVIVRLWEQTRSVEEFARALESRVLAERGQEPVAIVRDNPDDIGTIIEALGDTALPVGTELFTHLTPDDASQSANSSSVVESSTCAEQDDASTAFDERMQNGVRNGGK